MNRKELIDAIHKHTGVARADVDKVLRSLIQHTQVAVKKGDHVALAGFGTFERQDRKARTVRNPRTGELIKMKATKVPRFRAGQGFRDVVSGKATVPKSRKATPSYPAMPSTQGQLPPGGTIKVPPNTYMLLKRVVDDLGQLLGKEPRRGVSLPKIDRFLIQRSQYRRVLLDLAAIQPDDWASDWAIRLLMAHRYAQRAFDTLDRLTMTPHISRSGYLHDERDAIKAQHAIKRLHEALATILRLIVQYRLDAGGRS